MKKIGFLGGSFDPVHFGHLLAARDACEQMELDRLYFVPAARAPLKDREASASADERWEMLRLAIEGDSRFGALDHELRRGGTSYTVDAVREFSKQFPSDRLFWVIGADQVARLPEWNDIEVLAGLIEFIRADRPGGYPPEAPAVPGLRMHSIRSRRVEISSTELRARAAEGLPLHYLTPAPVAAYIQDRHLYRSN